MMVDTKDKQDKEVSKKFKGYLMLDWRKSIMKVRMTKPKSSDIKPYEIPIEVDINLYIPKRDVFQLSGDIDIKKETVNKLVWNNYDC